MGFGYLLLGYLITFVLRLTASALSLGSLALLIGYGMMLFGLWKLKDYCRSFLWAVGATGALLLTAVYRALEDLSDVFLWNLPIVGGSAEAVVTWAEFLLTMLFHAAMLSAIRELGMRVELRKISTAAVRNAVIILLYGVVYVLYRLPVSAWDSVRVYFNFFFYLLNLAWLICNLLLLLSCAKNICPAGQEEPQPKRYKWNFLNRIGDTFSGNLKKAADSNREEMERFLKKRQEKRRRRNRGADNDSSDHHQS